MRDAVLEQDTRPQRRPNRRRRLSDMVSITFHFACDQGDLEAADRLLAIPEFMLRRPPPAALVRWIVDDLEQRLGSGWDC